MRWIVYGVAAIVLVGDILKGIVACLIGLRIGVYVYSGEAKDCVSLLAAGAGATGTSLWGAAGPVASC